MISHTPIWKYRLRLCTPIKVDKENKITFHFLETLYPAIDELIIITN